jgi:hypothetical protein
MSKIKIGKLTPFLVIATIQVVVACLIFYNSVMVAIHGIPSHNVNIYLLVRFSSLAGFLLICGGVFISPLAVWFFIVKKHLRIFIPSFKLVILLATLLTLISAVYKIPGVLGWCCEVSPTHYFGFPFSYLRGDSLFGVLSNFKLALAIKNHGFLPFEFFLNFLSWSNIVFIVLSLVALINQRGKIPQPVKEQVQSESH